MAGQQGFVALPYQEVDAGIGEMRVEFFDNGRREDYITYKRCLYDQEFLHGTKLRLNLDL
jgi:hypothetical protein